LDTFDRLKGLEVNVIENAKRRRIFPDAVRWEAVAAIRGGRAASQVARLRKELDRTRMERDILKRAALIFGQATGGR
jgi:transposase-like protein